MKKNDLPYDADGDAIRRIIESGADLDRPMPIDVQIIAPNSEEAEFVEVMLLKAGFRVKKLFHHDTQDWDVIGTKDLILSYEAVIRLQSDAEQLLENLESSVDGWGSFGN